MEQTVNETVYLGRASFRITHEVETVETREQAPESADWFSHESAAVILKGGPSGLAARDGSEEQESAQQASPQRRGFRRSWLLVALPAAAFALGIAVASIAGTPKLRGQIVAAPAPATAGAQPAVAAPTPAQPGVTAPSLPAPPTVATAAPAPAEPSAEAAPPPAAEVAPEPAEAAPTEAPSTPRVTPSVPSHQPRAAKPHVARKAKTDHVKSSTVAAEEAAAAPGADAPKPEAAAPANKGAVKAAGKPAVKWVDPWAN